MSFVGALLELVVNAAIETSVTAALEAAFGGKNEQPDSTQLTERDRKNLEDLEPQSRAEIELWTPRTLASAASSDGSQYSGKAR
jgi:hypothetical protein